MAEELLRCVEIEPAGRAEASVIWLHGLGADGHDFEPIVPFLGLDRSPGVRFVFPNAPDRAVTINMGLLMPAWYDVRTLGGREEEDEKGIRQSAAAITALIERENSRGIPSERIVLAGFSQGGAVALHVGLRHPGRLAGLMVLSAYLVCEESVEPERSEANLGLPIFQAHGTMDPMVPFRAGTHCRDRLVALGYDVDWRDYPMQHQICDEEIADIGEWLRRVVAGSAAQAPPLEPRGPSG